MIGVKSELNSWPDGYECKTPFFGEWSCLRFMVLALSPQTERSGLMHVLLDPGAGNPKSERVRFPRGVVSVEQVTLTGSFVSLLSVRICYLPVEKRYQHG